MGTDEGGPPVHNVFLVGPLPSRVGFFQESFPVPVVSRTPDGSHRWTPIVQGGVTVLETDRGGEAPGVKRRDTFPSQPDRVTKTFTPLRVSLKFSIFLPVKFYL